MDLYVLGYKATVKLRFGPVLSTYQKVTTNSHLLSVFFDKILVSYILVS